MSDLCPTLNSLLALGFEPWTGNRRSRYGAVRFRTGEFNSLAAMLHGVREPVPGADTVFFAFADFDLFATHMMNRHFVMTVKLYGVLSTENELHDIDTEIHPDLGSPLDAAAWLSYRLYSYRDALGPLPDWFSKGQLHWDVIPEVRQMREAQARRRAYEESPKCFIAREEARVFRRKFLEVLAGLDGESEMRFSFNGIWLAIDLERVYFDARAWGEAWPDTYRVMVSSETKLPPRFMSSWVDVTLFDSQVFVDGLSLGSCETITQDSA